MALVLHSDPNGSRIICGKRLWEATKGSAGETTITGLLGVLWVGNLSRAQLGELVSALRAISWGDPVVLEDPRWLPAQLTGASELSRDLGSLCSLLYGSLIA